MIGETLYSWCSRFHRIAVGLDARATSRMLFGSISAGLHPDIPFNLRTFENNTQRYLGSAEKLLYQSTSFGFYSKFLAEDSRLKVTEFFMRAHILAARSKLGLNQDEATSRILLKYCPECSDFQYQTKRFTWWRVRHQLPTSFICHEHHRALNFLIVPHNRSYAKGFYTPSFRLDSFAMNQYFDDPYYRQQLIKISVLGDAIWRSSELQIPGEILRWCYLYRVLVRGWIGPGGKVKLNEIRNALVLYYGELPKVFGEKYLQEMSNVNSSFYSQLISKTSSRQHPIKHVLLINFLFDHFEDFLETYNDVTKDWLQGGNKLCKAIVAKNHSMIARIKLNAGQSLEQVVSLLELPAQSVAKCAGKNDSNKRILPRIIGTEKEMIMREKLQQGLAFREIAHIAGLRPSYIKQYLVKRPCLKREWKNAHHTRQIKLHREQFLSALRTYPTASFNVIRRTPKSGFNWLIVHDKEWLQNSLPAIWRR